MTFQEAQQNLTYKLGISYTNLNSNDLITSIMVRDWLNMAGLQAWDYARWPFAEKVYTTASTGAEYYDYPDDFYENSIYILRATDADGNYQIYEPTRYPDYLKYRSDYTAGTDKIWATHRRFYFVNPYACPTGRTIEITGRQRYTVLSEDSSLMAFSPDSDNEENSGNQAIVKLAYAIALASEKINNPQKALIEEKGAYQMLDIIYAKYQGDKSIYQTKNNPLFKYRRII